jgi:integrase
VQTVAKQARPWYRKSVNGWYICLNGKQVLLAKGKANKAEAYRKYADLVGEAPKPDSLTVGELVEGYLSYIQQRIRPKTLEVYTLFLRSFGETYGDQHAKDVRAFHLEDWSCKPNWNATSRNYALSLVNAMFRWAERTERLDHNPIRHLRKPACQIRSAGTLIDEEEHAQVMEHASNELRLYLTALHETGARPGEVASVTAADFDAEHGIWLLKQHKTAKKTGKPRIVYLTPELVSKCKMLANRHPEGSLFRNCRGQAWTKGALSKALNRIRVKLGLRKRLIAYGYRHSFATDALANGVPDAQVAELLGHSGTAMLHRHYSHLTARTQVLQAALGRVRP